LERKSEVILCLLDRGDGSRCQAKAVLAVIADDGEEDVLEGRLLLDVYNFGRGKQLLELGEGAIHDNRVASVYNLLAATANPENPNEVDVSQPSNALVAQADAEGAFDGLFLGLGIVALLVGAVGVANIMIISVLERRSEIGLRRALGATKGHVRVQFLAEAILLSLIGGVAGVGLGAFSTAVYASSKHEQIVIPVLAWSGGMGAALLIGAVAGLWPALRAARMSPTEALWSM